MKKPNEFETTARSYLKSRLQRRTHWDLKLIEVSAREICFDSRTRTITAIPAYVLEAGLTQAILAYQGNFDRLRSHHFVVFINAGPEITAQHYAGHLAVRLVELRRAFERLGTSRWTIMHAHFREKAAIGRIRGILSDAIILGALRKRLSDPVLISNDADQLCLPDHYLSSLHRAFRRNPSLDIIGGKVLWGGYGPRGESHLPRKLRLPELYIGSILLGALEKLQTYKENRSIPLVSTFGNNSAMRLRALCAIGGYAFDHALAEDTQLSEKVFHFRRNRLFSRKGQRYILASRSAYVITDPRRGLRSILDGSTLSGQWSSFTRIKGGSLDSTELSRIYLSKDSLLQLRDVRAATSGSATRMKKLRARLEFMFWETARSGSLNTWEDLSLLARHAGFSLRHTRGSNEVDTGIQMDWDKCPIVRKLEEWARQPP